MRCCFNDTATTEIYTLSLHDALPISGALPRGPTRSPAVAAARERRQQRGSAGTPRTREDRKSTRLNSSHANISYAVFCLKKKHRGSAMIQPVRPDKAPLLSQTIYAVT